MISTKATKIQAVLNYVTGNPGLTAKEISTRLGMELGYVCVSLTRLSNKGIIETKGVHNAHTYWPVMRSTVLSDASLPIAAPKDENPLSRFTDRELYEELKSRGVAWDRMWKKVYIEYSKI